MQVCITNHHAVPTPPHASRPQAGMYWKFKPTTYCAAECPTGFSIKSPVMYGGATYPGATQPPGKWYAYQTQDVLGRCFPKDTTVRARLREVGVMCVCGRMGWVVGWV